MTAPIKTDHLTLRPLTLADAPRIARFTGDFDVARMVSSIPHPHLLVSVEGWILMLEARAGLSREHVFAIDLPGEGLAGCIGASRAPGADWEIGYWVGRPYWGRGIATEAAQAMTSFVRRELTRGPVLAGHFADNPASGRVLQKAGFVYTGEVKPRFSLARGSKAATRIMKYAH